MKKLFLLILIIILSIVETYLIIKKFPILIDNIDAITTPKNLIWLLFAFAMFSIYISVITKRNKK